MKKNLLLLFLVFLSFNFIACSDDNDSAPIPVEPVDAAYFTEGNYETSIVGSTSTGIHDILTSQYVSLSKIGENLIKFKTGKIKLGTTPNANLGEITLDSIIIKIDGENKFSFEKTDSIKVGWNKTEAKLKGTIIDKVLYAELDLAETEMNVSLKFDGQQIENNKAEVLDFTIVHEAIDSISTFDAKTMTIFVKSGTLIEELQFAPTLKLSKGAISHPASGELVDFSKAIDKDNDTKYVTYTVISEDKEVKGTYKIKVKINFAKSSFEEWEGEGDGSDLSFQKPVGGVWSTSNPGIILIKTMFKHLYSGGSIVYDIAGQTGKGAAIKTANTTGQAKAGWMPAIPKITSGSLFLGSFEVDIANTLKSTKFGVPYFQKPVKVKGFFKYTPGADYYTCKDWENASNTAILDPTKTDECALSAVLYEVSSFTNENDLLTGVNIFKSDKIVAIKQLFSAGQADFTEFELVLDYKKEYDPTKKYRLAVIFSSSKDGDKFSGAPESLLVVDEVEIINE